MTTLAQLRKAALALPETVEEDGPRRGTFRVGGKPIASVSDNIVQLHLASADIDAVAAAHPTAEPVSRGEHRVAVRVPLDDINGQQLNHWVRRAWYHRAPKRLATKIAAADSAAPGGVGDLPKAIGRPATQALAGAGITTLAQLAGRSDAELLAMHGVGPKAVRILRAELTARFPNGPST
jgi:hypothetical protein